MKAPILIDPDKEAPVAEETNPVLLDLIEGMVKKQSMALDC